MSYMKEFTKGLIKENPNLVMLLGMCPTLAVTVMAENGLGMGLATTFVLVCSNLVISLLKKVIPDTVRLPCFIVIIAGFVTLVSLLLDAFLPELAKELGVFLSLITVNCIILGRAEMFACKNKVIPSILDGLGTQAVGAQLFPQQQKNRQNGAGKKQYVSVQVKEYPAVGKMAFALGRKGQHAAGKGPAGQGQIVQNPVVGILQLLGRQAGVGFQPHGFDVGIVKGPNVNGQGNGGGEDKQNQRQGKNYGNQRPGFHGNSPCIIMGTSYHILPGLERKIIV